jgi:hypothetical protein
MTAQAKPRLIADCPVMIFIAYTVGEEAVAKGYHPWLVETDNPFFNAIPGVHHYANWIVDGVSKGGPLSWTYYDFQGLADESDLERVWFNPDLDGFRKEWIRLWGYGPGERPPVLRHAYLCRRVSRSNAAPREKLRLSAGQGKPPAGGDLTFAVTDVLAKHFAGVGSAKWNWPIAEGNPLGLEWLRVDYAPDAPDVPEAELVLSAGLIAAP